MPVVDVVAVVVLVGVSVGPPPAEAAAAGPAPAEAADAAAAERDIRRHSRVEMTSTLEEYNVVGWSLLFFN